MFSTSKIEETKIEGDGNNGYQTLELEDDDESNDDTAAATTAVPATVELKPRDDTPVQLQIKDVREAVGGTIPTEDDKTSDSFL